VEGGDGLPFFELERRAEWRRAGMEEGKNGGWLIEMDVGYEMIRRERHQSVDVYLSFEDSGRFMIRRISSHGTGAVGDKIN
jgi:hypothetical protein